MNRRTLRALSLPALLCVAALSMASCNIVGPAYMLVAGPPKTDARFELDPKARAVIFIDDQGSYLPRRSLRTTISTEVEKLLADQRAVGTLIASQAIQLAAMQDEAGRPSDLTTLGKKVEADLVVHALVDSFSMSPDGGATYEPFASALVRVVDTRTGQRVWPTSDDAPNGYRLSIRLPVRQSDVPTSAAQLAKAQETLATRFGTAIARLFYRHEVNADRLRDSR